MKLRCSRCGKILEDIIIKVDSSVTPMKIVDGCQLVPVDNVRETTSEHLCLDCFNAYANCINQLNQAYDGIYQASMVEVIDDIQYGDKC